MRRIIIFMFIFCIFLFPKFIYGTDQQEINQNLNDLDNFIERGIKDWEIPGLAVAVVKEGKVIYSKGFGVRDLKLKDKVTNKTLFSIASATKSFTATLAAMFVDEKKIKWDEPLTESFPGFRMYDSSVTDKVTFIDLMIHRTGIGRQAFYRNNIPDSRAQLFNDYKHFEPKIDFRSGFRYSNLSFTLAGYLLAKKENSTWEDLVQQRIFDPLGMKDSIFSTEQMQKTEDYARPYIDWGKGIEPLPYHNADVLGPAGSIVSNVQDMSRWLIFNLNKGKVGEKLLVSAQNFNFLQRPQIAASGSRRFPEKFYSSYGIGWFISSYRGHLYLHHGGVLVGFTSIVSFLPDENIGIVILMNKNFCQFVYALESHIYDLLLGVKGQDWNKRYLDYVNKMIASYKKFMNKEDPYYKPKTMRSHDLKDYTGIFKNEGYGKIEIILEGKKLKGKITTAICPLKHYNYDVFELHHPINHQSWKVAFVSDLRGEINSFKVHLGRGLKYIMFKRISK